MTRFLGIQWFAFEIMMLAASAAPIALAQAEDLSVQVRQQPGGATFEFTEPDNESTITRTNCDHGANYQVFTSLDGGHFDGSFRKTSFEPEQFGGFRFEVCVHNIRTGKAKTFTVQETPSRDQVFLDHIASLPISIRSGSVQENAELVQIPVHADNEDKVFTLNDDSLLQVKLGAKSTVHLPLKSNLDGLNAKIEAISVAPQCDDCWTLAPSASPSTSVIGPRGTASLNLALAPKTLYVLEAYVFDMHTDKPQDWLVVLITNTPEQGGRTNTQRIVVPVRFSPSLLQLTISIVLGVLAGFGFRNLLLTITRGGSNAPNSPQAGPPRNWLTISLPPWAIDLTQSLIIAAAVEILGLIIFSTTSTAVVFCGLHFDPSQLTSAFLMSALVAGRHPVLVWFLKQLTSF